MNIKKLILLLGLLTPVLSHAQTYSINWYKVAGGGGTSNGTNISGTIYSVSGTIGQQDASSAMTGGVYALTGGFWSLIALVQNTSGPTLSIAYSNNSAIVSWPYPSTGYVLQTNTNLSTTNWVNYTGAIVTNFNGTGSNDTTVAPPTGHVFFRLGP